MVLDWILNGRTRTIRIVALVVVSIVNNIGASIRSAEHIQAESFAILIHLTDGLTARDQGSTTALCQESVAEAK